MPGEREHEHERDHQKPGAKLGQPWTLLLVGFAVIAGYFLLTEHRAHVVAALPYILWAAAMFFCMFGHRHAGDRDRREIGGER